MNSNHSRELDILFDNSPGVLRNSAVILITRIVAWILAIILLSFGISLFFDDARRELLTFLGVTLPVAEQVDFVRGVGILLLITSLCLFLIVTLCKMIMRRNAFLLELFVWHEELKETDRQNQHKDSKKKV